MCILNLESSCVIFCMTLTCTYWGDTIKLFRMCYEDFTTEGHLGAQLVKRQDSCFFLAQVMISLWVQAPLPALC